VLQEQSQTKGLKGRFEEDQRTFFFFYVGFLYDTFLLYENHGAGWWCHNLIATRRNKVCPYSVYSTRNKPVIFRFLIIWPMLINLQQIGKLGSFQFRAAVLVASFCFRITSLSWVIQCLLIHCLLIQHFLIPTLPTRKKSYSKILASSHPLSFTSSPSFKFWPQQVTHSVLLRLAMVFSTGEDERESVVANKGCRGSPPILRLQWCLMITKLM
jgi:hypothetical protein